MKNEEIIKEYFDKLAEVLEREFEKGEECECGRRLPCRSKALVLNSYANIYLKDALQQTEIRVRGEIRESLEKVLYEMENHISGEDSLWIFADRIRNLLTKKQ